MSAIKILAGDYKVGSHHTFSIPLAAGNGKDPHFNLTPHTTLVKKNIHPKDVEDIEFASEESIARVGRGLG